MRGLTVWNRDDAAARCRKHTARCRASIYTYNEQVVLTFAIEEVPTESSLCVAISIGKIAATLASLVVSHVG